MIKSIMSKIIVFSFLTLFMTSVKAQGRNRNAMYQQEIQWGANQDYHSEFLCADGCASFRDLYAGLRAEPEVRMRIDKFEEGARDYIEDKLGIQADTFLSIAGLGLELSRQRLSTRQFRIKSSWNGIEIRPSMEYRFNEKNVFCQVDFRLTF